MKIKYIVSLLFFLLSYQIFATTHVIQFGGGVGMKYSPDSLHAKVGDIIRWEGSFSSHPLVSTSIPAGAVAISVSTGVTFEYTLTKPGDYRYWCDFHQFKGVIKVAESADVQKPIVEFPSMFFNSVNKSLHVINKNEGEVLIQDVNGKVVFQFESKEIIDLSFLKGGVYTACLFKRSETIQLLRFLTID